MEAYNVCLPQSSATVPIQLHSHSSPYLSHFNISSLSVLD